jgi:hypothetical protein
VGWARCALSQTRRSGARSPIDRFPTAQALSEAVERFLDGDRDVACRRELAAEYAAEAAAQAARALDRKTPAAEADESRTLALRGTMHALALAPDQPDAQRTLGKLLVEMPREIRPAARAERDELVTTERVEGARLLFMVFMAYFAAVPLALLVGIKSWLIVTIALAVVTTGAVSSRWMEKRRAVKRRQFMFLVTLSVLIVFFFLPVAVAGVLVVALLSGGVWFGAAACALAGCGTAALLQYRFLYPIRIRVRHISASGAVTLGGVDEAAALAIEGMQAESEAAE